VIESIILVERAWGWINALKACLDIEKFKTSCKSEERNCGRCKAELLSKLLIYSVLYGVFSINYIDLVVPGSNVPGYHLWLLIAYFAPFIPLLLLFGFEDWELVGGLGLTASLMNDIFYYPTGMLLLRTSVNLSEWYLFQFGFKGFDVWWSFNAGFFTIPVTSLLMGLTIYLRIGIVVALIYKWWNYKRTCNKLTSIT